MQIRTWALSAALLAGASISGLGLAATIERPDGNETLTGSPAAETITGGPGLDVMNGGGGADVFVFGAGHGGPVEPHDDVIGFVRCTTRLVLPGAILATQEKNGGTFLKYGETDTSWLFLRGVTGLTTAQLPNLTDLATCGGGTTPPPTGGTINGTTGNDTLNGTAGNDTINGLAGNDTINGLAGNDTITGGAGIDTMNGGTGANVFIFANGHGGPVEPHDRIVGFQHCVDRLQLPTGGVISTQTGDAGGLYIKYAGGNDLNWIQLGGIADLTSQQLTQLTDLATCGQPPPTGGGGGGASNEYPAHTTTVTESFNGGVGAFSNNWGVVETNVAGQITTRSVAGTWLDAGAMMQYSQTFGYGLFEFEMRTNKPKAGCYGLTWPENDTWPGPELDVFEVLESGRAYATIHWDDNGNNAYAAYLYPSVDVTQFQTYAMLWERGRISYFLNGVRVNVTTDNVPDSRADGGLNTVPGIGSQTWWNIDQQGGTDSTCTIREFRYSTVP